MVLSMAFGIGRFIIPFIGHAPFCDLRSRDQHGVDRRVPDRPVLGVDRDAAREALGAEAPDLGTQGVDAPRRNLRVAHHAVRFAIVFPTRSMVWSRPIAW